MARWKELPDMHDQRVRQLFVQLRRLKDRSGMSLTSLAAKTGYSRSSWERYLNGKALPPRQAVEELARATGADPARLLALHEVAEEVWQQRVPAPPGTGQDGQEATADGRAGEPDQRPDPEQEATATAAERPPGVRKPVVLAAVVLAALLGTGAGILIGLPLGGGGADRPPAAQSTPSARPSGSTTASTGPGRYVFKPGRTYPCKVRRGGGSGGGLSAGYSTTRTAVLAGPGWDVVEAQCLLRHRRLDPGVVDGVYGQQTIAAVMRLQKQAGLPADGVVGPHTWQALRG
ncbi:MULTISPECIES: helix-turn-helix domain-containing protein [Streptomyces]|nr:helix-turn-helix domain-containing protein [Streptomyces sp. DSM 40868]QIS75341.1 helix-turn-helix domain-containing protein [Streptomyces sp. DSM 40868]WDM14266.1 peptidoglycan-binding protein [Streptomyces lavenduligriseus]